MKRDRSEPPRERTPLKNLVVWDFDWSLVNENSDTYLIERLDSSSRRIMKMVDQRESSMGWTELMDAAVGELHAEGRTPEALKEALATIPILDGAKAAVAAAAAVEAPTQQRILSDANTVYIETILERRGFASGTFAAVVTNAGAFDEATGRLHIRPHQPAGRSHGCKLCPPNLCKGKVLDAWLATEVAPERIIYVGDGGGDYCPATRLRPEDVLLARRSPHDGLLRRCRRDPSAVRAQVVEWDEAADGESLRHGLVSALRS